VVSDRKTGQQVLNGTIGLDPYVLKDNPVVPVGLKLPLASLSPGAYQVHLKASDSAGNHSAVRTADFDLE
jgi:hypothetical protein